MKKSQTSKKTAVTNAELQVEIRSLGQSIVALTKATTLGFERVAKQFSKVFEKQNDHDVKFDKVFDKLSDHDENFQTGFEKLDSHDKELQKVNSKLTGHDKAFETIISELSSFRNEAGFNRNMMSGLTRSDAEQETEITSVRFRVERLEKEVRALAVAKKN